MMNEYVNLLVALNDGFVMPVVTMIKSFEKNSHANKIRVFALYTSLKNENKKIMVENVDKKITSFTFIDCSAYLDRLKCFSVSESYWSMETYYRLFIGEVLPDSIDRILYLDGDIIVRASIMEFYNRDFRGKAIAACEDFAISHKNIKVYNNLKLNIKQKYFNAGVILFNMEYFKRNRDFLDKVMYIGTEYRGKLLLNDQDVLNLVFQKKVLWIDERYNTFITSIFSKNDMKNKLMEASIVHFCGRTKPWQPKYRYLGEDLFWKYCNMTSFAKEYEGWKKKRKIYRIIPFSTLRRIKKVYDQIFK